MSEIVPLPMTTGKRPLQEQDIDTHKILQGTMNVMLTLEEILRTQIHTWLKQDGKNGVECENLERTIEETPKE